MTLYTRPVSSIGDPLCLPDGTPLSGTVITFTLVSSRGQPLDAWDATSGERVAGKLATTTTADGEFTVDLWPNSRGTYPTKYLCHVDHPGIRDFYGIVLEGVDALSWIQFMAGGESSGGPTSGSPGGFSVNLSAILAPETITVSSGTGTSAVLPAASDAFAGLMLPAQVGKLSGIALNANDYTHPDSHPPGIIEQDAGHRFVTDAEKAAWNGKQPVCTPIACGDEVTPIVVKDGVVTFHWPQSGTLIEVWIGVNAVQVSGNKLTVDLKNAGVSMLSTKVTIDNTQENSLNAAVQPVISGVTVVKGTRATVDVTQVGDLTAKGLKMYFTVQPS